MNNLKAERTLTAENRVSDEVLATMIAFEIHARDRYPAGSIGHETHRDQVKALTELQYLRSQSLSTQQPMGEVVAWTWKDAGGRVKVAPHDDWFEKPRNVALLDAKPLYALHPNQESGE